MFMRTGISRIEGLAAERGEAEVTSESGEKKSEVRGLGCDTITVCCDAVQCGGF